MVSSVGSTPPWGMQQLSGVSAAQRHNEVFKKLDSNNDGSIDESELTAGKPANGKEKSAADVLKEADTSGNGLIEQSENDTFLSNMESKRPSGPPPGGKPNGGGMPQAGGAAKSSSQVFDELDTNKDGKVSMEELIAAMGSDKDEEQITSLMKEIDTDNSGSIDKTENEAFMKKMEDQRDQMMQNAPSYDQEGNGVVDSVGGNINMLM